MMNNATTANQATVMEMDTVVSSYDLGLLLEGFGSFPSGLFCRESVKERTPTVPHLGEKSTRGHHDRPRSPCRGSTDRVFNGQVHCSSSRSITDRIKQRRIDAIVTFW